MPNNTKEPNLSEDWKPDPSTMNKSWVEIAAEDDEDFYGDIKTEDIVKTPVKEVSEIEEDKPKAHKRINFNASFKDIPTKDEVMESPMKVESPLKVMESPIKLDMESPMKTEQSPAKSEVNSDVKKRLWSSPRRRDEHHINLGPRVSPRRPLMPADVMSPPREALKRKRNKDLFCSSPVGSIGSPGSDRSSVFSPRAKRKPIEIESDPDVLNRRQKQIDYGKNTEGYRCYVEAIPKYQRSHKHPQTPPREAKYSRRAWDGMVRSWRQQLHLWDPPGTAGSLDTLDCLDTTDTMSEISIGSGSHLSDNVSEISYPGSGSKHRAQRPASTLSLDDFPPLS